MAVSSPDRAAETVTAAPLHRGLRPRHMQMMAVGGTIGTGLFLGSGRGIATAGPALILSYALAGIVVFCVMRALGEMAVRLPTSGSFTAYARRYLGPFAGFTTGWTYWLQCVATAMADLTASGIYLRYWWPGLPQWIPAFGALIVLFCVHWVSVRLFGEFEFWFALIKVVAIVGLILLGVIILLTGVTALGHGASIANLWRSGGFFPHGLRGPFVALQLAIFAFIGVEMLGMTAGEAQDPDRTIPRAVNSVIWRILIFYIGALLVLMVMQPWDNYNAAHSPFVSALTKTGLVGAAGILNFVVLTSALSSCNSQIYADSRLLHDLGSNGAAPRSLVKTTRRGVPGRALTLSVVAIGVGVVLNYVAPGNAFVWITSIVTVSGLWAWGVIAIAHLRFRREQRDSAVQFRLPASPGTNIFIVVAVVASLVSLGFSPDTRIGLYAAAVWAVLLTICYQFRRRALSDKKAVG